MIEPLPAEDLAFARYRDEGDVDALGEVFDRLAPALLRFARGLLADPQHAEDVVQQAFVVAIDGRAQWDAERRLLPWLLGVVAHRARNLGRRERRRQAVDLTAAAGLPGASPAPGDAAAADEVVAVVRKAIDALPEPYGPVLELHLHHGMTAAEIARTLRRPAVTVRSQIRRGMQLLRAALPAGLAATGAGVALPGAALAAMRAAVLKQARAVATETAVAGSGASASATALGLPVAALMMNKSLSLGLAALLVVGVSVTVALWPKDESRDLAVAPPGGDPAARIVAAGSATEAAPPRDAPVARAEVPAVGREPPTLDAVAGALVVRVLQDWDGAPADLVTVVAPDAAGAAITYVTDDDGVARCAEVAAGVRVELPDFRLAATVGDPDDGLTFRVPPRLEVEVEVVGRDGDPVADAEVFMFRGLGPDLRRVVLGRSDAGGRLRLRTARPMVALRACAAGHLPGSQQLVTARRPPRGALRLELGAAAPTATITAVRADGSPVGGAKVAVFDLTDDRRHPLLAETDAQGRAVLVVPAATPLLVLAAHGDGASAHRALVAWSTQATGELAVTLGPAAELRGRVTDTRGVPVAGATVHARWHDERIADAFTRGWRGAVATDGEGRYRLEGLMPAAAELRLEGTGVATAARITLEAGRTSDWSPVVDPPAIWQLRLEDPTGAALEGWLVAVRGTGPEAELLEAITRADGTVSFPAPAGRVDVRVQGPAHGSGVAAVFDAALQHRWQAVSVAGTERLVVPADRLPSAELRGVLVDEQGVPLAGVEVQVVRRRGDETLVQALTSTADGSFALGPTAPGTASVAARHGAHSMLKTDVELLPGRATDLGTVILAAGARLAVRVTSAPATPRVWVRIAAQVPPLELRRDADGRYVTAEALPAGEYAVELRDGERPVATRVVRLAGGGTVEVELGGG